MSTGQFRLKKPLRGAGEAEVWGLCTQQVCRGQSPAEGLGAKSPRSCGINALLQHAVTVNTPSRYAANIYTIQYDTSREDRVADNDRILIIVIIIIISSIPSPLTLSFQA